MDTDKLIFIEAHFEELEKDLKRAKRLYRSRSFLLEGVTILICQLSSLANSRYPYLPDWKSFKTLIKEYSGKYNLFSNIDLLFYYQWKESKLAKDKIYHELQQYEEILEVFKKEIGDENHIRSNPSSRYKKRDELSALLSSKIESFDNDNFARYIELYSNNQIFYQYARCESVHNNEFPLINIGIRLPSKERTYTDNHQITSQVILDSLETALEQLKQECLKKGMWIHQLCV